MNRPDEHDEFLLSRLLDGDLPDEEAGTLNARLEREPELRATLDALTRIDALLADRRGKGPDVDWARFHAGVMDKVTARAASRAWTLRFPRWLRVAAPLAAAASLALVIMLRQLPQSLKESPAPTPPVRVVYNAPAPDAAGRLVVEYNRHPTRVDRDRAGPKPIRVAYTRSDELQEAIRRYDKARESRPVWHLYTAHSDAPEPSLDDFLGTPAM